MADASTRHARVKQRGTTFTTPGANTATWWRSCGLAAWAMSIVCSAGGRGQHPLQRRAGPQLRTRLRLLARAGPKRPYEPLRSIVRSHLWDTPRHVHRFMGHIMDVAVWALDLGAPGRCRDGRAFRRRRSDRDARNHGGDARVSEGDVPSACGQRRIQLHAHGRHRLRVRGQRSATRHHYGTRGLREGKVSRTFASRADHSDSPGHLRESSTASRRGARDHVNVRYGTATKWDCSRHPPTAPATPRVGRRAGAFRGRPRRDKYLRASSANRTTCNAERRTQKRRRRTQSAERRSERRTSNANAGDDGDL